MIMAIEQFIVGKAIMSVMKKELVRVHVGHVILMYEKNK